jgi:hypothetical protein
MKLNIARSKEQTMNHYRRRIEPARVAILVVLALVITGSIVKLSRATIGTITKADLSGAWAATLTGDTGCGIATSHFTFTLSAAGSGSGTLQSHTSGCGNITNTQTFTITSLSSNGSGTATLTCGTGCAFTFTIQVTPDRSVFTLVDVTDPGNFLEGVAVHQ